MSSFCSLIFGVMGCVPLIAFSILLRDPEIEAGFRGSPMVWVLSLLGVLIFAVFLTGAIAYLLVIYHLARGNDAKCTFMVRLGSVILSLAIPLGTIVALFPLSAHKEWKKGRSDG